MKLKLYKLEHCDTKGHEAQNAASKDPEPSQQDSN